MPRVYKLMIMILFSFLVAFFFTASGDPLTIYVRTVAVLCIAVPSYLSGVREGREDARISRRKATRNTANADQILEKNRDE